eukprot:TRINITY_DN455_c5_g1_i1.p1 TRINITY_DN455_c5_g1~~TRINITY_DN455_c5_g1_i1.p1  ORF type:complete len:550 (+),score=185.09 TRINITY_DN455_c5_g1_i1:83-1732(+)
MEDSSSPHDTRSKGTGNGIGRELAEEPSFSPESPMTPDGRRSFEGDETGTDSAANETIDLEEHVMDDDTPQLDDPHGEEEGNAEGVTSAPTAMDRDGDGEAGVAANEIPLREPRFESFADCSFNVKVDCSKRDQFLLGTYGIRVEVVSAGKEKIVETIRHRKDFVVLREFLLRKYPQYFIPVVPDSKWMKRIFSRNFTTIFEGLLVRFLEKVSHHHVMGCSPVFLGFFEATQDGVYNPTEWEREPFQPRRDLWNKLRLSLKTLTRKMKTDSKADGDYVFWKEMQKDLLHLEKSLEKLYDYERDVEAEFGALGESFLLLGRVDPSLRSIYEPARRATFSTAMLWQESHPDRYRFISEWLHPATEDVRAVQQLFERRDLSRIVRDMDDSDFDKKRDDPHRQALCMHSKVVCQDIEANTKSETDAALEVIQGGLLHGAKEFSYLHTKIHRIASKAFSTMDQSIQRVPIEGVMPEFLRRSTTTESSSVTPPSTLDRDGSHDNTDDVCDQNKEEDDKEEEEDEHEVEVMDEEEEEEEEEEEHKHSSSRELAPEM